MPWAAALIAAVVLAPLQADAHGTARTSLWVVAADQAAELPAGAQDKDVVNGGVFASLHVAVAAAAELTPPATIHLAPGEHRLTRTLELKASHSGIQIVGHGTAVVTGGVRIGNPPPPDSVPSGGRNVSGWTVVGPAKCPGCSVIWKAATPKGMDSRQFYVNGVRANRTWMKIPGNTTHEKSSTFLMVPGAAMLGWTKNVSAIDLVYRGAASAGSQWQESRCPVAALVSGGPPKPAISTLDECAAKAKTCANANFVSFSAKFHDCSWFETCSFTSASLRRFAGNGTDYQSQVLHNGTQAVGCCGDLYECTRPLGNLNADCKTANRGNWDTFGNASTASTVVHAPPLHYVAANATKVEVAKPCVTNGNNKIHGTQPLRVPVFVENVFELLGSAEHGHPGEYFLDSVEGFVYYVPHAGETTADVEGVLPSVEVLVNATGVHNASFTNLVFEYATWMRPSSSIGFVDIQAGFCLACPVGKESGCAQDPGDGRGVSPATAALIFEETPAAVAFHAAREITIDGCRFQHLGSNGLSFSSDLSGLGSQNNTVRHSTFADISASAVAIGTRGNPTNRSSPAQQDTSNTVADCTITHVAREYRGHPALLVGFSRRTTLIHNAISMVPYSGVSLGWGWSAFPYTFGGQNSIIGNHIWRHMQVLGDGGGIYTLGAQGNLPFHSPYHPYKNETVILPPSVMHRNHIHSAGNTETAKLDHDGLGEGSHSPGGLYTDTGSTNWNISSNVVQDVPMWLMGCRSYDPWIGPDWQNHNWYDNASHHSDNQASRCPATGMEVDGAQWPAAAVEIMQRAGPRTKGR